MGTYVVTDLTRFDKPDKFCIAVINTETGNCLRPIPYLSGKSCEKFNVHPGAILDGDIVQKSNAANPHIEDSDWGNLKYKGKVSGDEFKSILDDTLSPTVASSFIPKPDADRKSVV